MYNLIYAYIQCIVFCCKPVFTHTYVHTSKLQCIHRYIPTYLHTYKYAQDGQKVREEMAMAVQEVMYKWLHETDEMKRRVAIFDGNFTLQ